MLRLLLDSLLVAATEYSVQEAKRQYLDMLLKLPLYVRHFTVVFIDSLMLFIFCRALATLMS